MLNSFKIGHYTDSENGTGCTVVICEKGATAGVSVKGSSPATRETDLLASEKTVQKIHSVVLSGGSAFGLEAACGVMEYLKDNDIGYQMPATKVPIVSSACIYDLEYKKFAYPDKKAGYEAAVNATAGNFERGEIGAATGATASKILGNEYAVKTKLGIQTYRYNQLEMAVIVSVNALGDIVKDGKIISGMKGPDGKFLSVKRVMSAGGACPENNNTTIGVVLTNAKISKLEANILASLAHNGLAKSISPAHTMYDGDALFVMSSNEVEIEFDILTSITPDLVEQAVHSSVVDVKSVDARVSKSLFNIFQKIWKRKKQ